MALLEIKYVQQCVTCPFFDILQLNIFGSQNFNLAPNNLGQGAIWFLVFEPKKPACRSTNQLHINDPGARVTQILFSGVTICRVSTICPISWRIEKGRELLIFNNSSAFAGLLGMCSNFGLHFVHVTADASAISHRAISHRPMHRLMQSVTLADALASADGKFLAIDPSLLGTRNTRVPDVLSYFTARYCAVPRGAGCSIDIKKQRRPAPRGTASE
uniref:Uncharacterized protein n=1 Tax=Romanomermis culicivorax TaxID=13658 RepID=A0A915KGP4_ROMCU